MAVFVRDILSDLYLHIFKISCPKRKEDTDRIAENVCFHFGPKRGEEENPVSICLIV